MIIITINQLSKHRLMILDLVHQIGAELERGTHTQLKLSGNNITSLAIGFLSRLLIHT